MQSFPLALSIFLDTLEQVRPATAIRSHVRYEDGSLRIGELVYPMETFGRVLLVAIGKAAVPIGCSNCRTKRNGPPSTPTGTKSRPARAWRFNPAAAAVGAIR